jgi:hypothetical protein
MSRGAARGCLRIFQKAPEDGIADAPLEAPQSLLARFALIYVLAVVGAAPSTSDLAWQVATMCRA